MQLEEYILYVARVESGTLILNKEKFNLNEMIIEILRYFQQNLKLFYEYYNKEEITIYADRSRFYQIICNLLNNAIKFTDEGSLTVIVERKDNSNNDEIVVSIKDTGTGID